MTAYSITPVGARGREEERTEVIDIPTKVEVMEENLRLREDLDKLRAQADVLWRERWAEQADLRIEAQNRLNLAARTLAVLAFAYPELRGPIRRARQDIWG